MFYLSRSQYSSQYIQAKENSKIKDAFESLVRKIVAKSPKAGQSDGKDNSAGGVFGGGKEDE